MFLNSIDASAELGHYLSSKRRLPYAARPKNDGNRLFLERL